MRAGERLAGRYRLDVRLGQGGSGEVWRAYDVELGRAVAVKVLLEFDASEELLRRFRREAAIGARLQHPGITVVHDIGQHEDRLFTVMELLEGEDLAHLLARSPGGGLPLPEALGLGLRAAEALEAAHAQKVVHRDLKPANLFLLTDGRLKICDFGIARTADSTGGLTVTGRVFGTPSYMAPEQWRGEHVEASCDLYALGCVLFALLTGGPPFPGDGQAVWVLMRRHLEETPRALGDVRADVPAALAELVASLLAKDPADRPDAPATTERLRALLRAAPAPAPAAAPVPAPAAGRRPEPTPPGPAVPATRRGPSRRGLVLGGLGIVAAASGGGLAAWRLGGDATDGEPSVVLAGHSGSVRAMAFGQDGKSLGSVDGNRVVRLWDISRRTSTATPTGSSDRPQAVAFGPGLTTLALARTEVQLWDVARRSGTVFTEPPGTGDGGGVLRSMAFGPDGKTLATGREGGVLQIWDTGLGQATGQVVRMNVTATALAFSPDGRTVAVGRLDTSLRLWDVGGHRSSTDPFDVPSHGDTVTSVVFSPDGRTLASACVDGTVRLWDATRRDAAPVKLKGHTDIVTSVAFSPDGRTLASGGNDRSVRLWDVAAGTRVATLTGHTGNVTSVAFSPDGRTLASGDDDTVRLWTPSRLRR
ncbi:WD40 repeat domain-containing serine/threonine protein kinase [Streptomyces lavendulae]|uniref:WD40 repeat domain-containing serine/threonine protein kinase n=1 Tax=Streptomyces lavendulae TaxID=1914 RepID=UPI0036966D9E